MNSTDSVNSDDKTAIDVRNNIRKKKRREDIRDNKRIFNMGNDNIGIKETQIWFVRGEYSKTFHQKAT